MGQESRGRDCPIISVSRLESGSTGQPQTYKANIQGGAPSVTPTFKWAVSSGEITGGQGAAEVSVDVQGSNSITVTVEVIGYATSCPNKAAYSWVIDGVMPRKFDKYGNLRFTEERQRLNQLAMELQKEPNAKGYIVVYGETNTRRTEARERGEKSRNYLIKEHGFKEAQIIVVAGGCREKFTVELFIAPVGVPPPTTTPAPEVDSSPVNSRVRR